LTITTVKLLYVGTIAESIQVCDIPRYWSWNFAKWH